MCVCDASLQPYGCTHDLNETYFGTQPTGDVLRVIGCQPRRGDPAAKRIMDGREVCEHAG